MLNSAFPGGGVNIKDATADPDDVLFGETFYSREKPKKVGTLQLTGDALPSHVLAGKGFYRDNAKVKEVGNIPSKGAQTYTPGTSNQTIAAGQYLNGVQTIAGNADLVAGNIKKGVNIFNVTGTLGLPTPITAGDVKIYTLIRAEVVTGYGSYNTKELNTNGWKVKCNIAGNYRITFSSWGYGSGAAQAHLLKNDVIIATNTHMTGTNQEVTVVRVIDVTLAQNDYLSFRILANGGSGINTCTIGGFSAGVAYSFVQTEVSTLFTVM